MEPMARFLRTGDWEVYSISLKPSWGEVGIEQLALQLKQFIDSNITPGRDFDLVGFSMGGLVSRYYLQRLGGLDRVKRFIKLATPHHGTVIAWLGWNTGCQQMRPNSLFLQDLNRDLPTLEQTQFTSIWTPLDLMILPADSSRTGLGREIKIWMPAHPLMVLHPKCIRAVAAELTR